MKPIGGFFELELNSSTGEFHTGALPVNSGRNALKLILMNKKIKKVYLPYFSCRVLLQPLYDMDISYEFYRIDENFEPHFTYNNLKDNEGFIYINYYGLKRDFIKTIAPKISNLIVDNAQAFFNHPEEGVDTFYSCRKFFGVPDGGYVYCREIIKTPLKRDTSLNNFSHLISRLEKEPEEILNVYRDSEKKIGEKKLAKMSLFTQRILSSLDYMKIAQNRKANFDILNDDLKEFNEIKIDFDQKDLVPFFYPFYTKNDTLREKLKESRIYTPIFWPEIERFSKKYKLESKFVRNIINLPLDQRYSYSDMKRITNAIKRILGGGK